MDFVSVLDINGVVTLGVPQNYYDGALDYYCSDTGIYIRCIGHHQQMNQIWFAWKGCGNLFDVPHWEITQKYPIFDVLIETKWSLDGIGFFEKI